VITWGLFTPWTPTEWSAPTTSASRPDTIRVIPPKEDLYCVDFAQDQSKILKVSRQWLVGYVGDILMVQAGENNGLPPVLFIVYWNGTAFEVHSIPLHDFHNSGDFFEKAALAPITLPTIAQ
jgi:hypothetical protein